MVELVNIPSIPEGNISDDDLLLIYDITAGRSYKITRLLLFSGLARLNQEAEFSALAAEEATFTEATVAQLLFASGGGIADMVTASASVAVPTLTAGATGSVNIPVTGAVSGMVALCTFTDGLAPGLCFTAHVSAADVVTVAFANASSGSISGETKAARIALLTLP